ncbi:unnamed protein product [Didymodactylos carnosus]|uniref:Uncharacterized protein n=1 Tax=Didymodactylos carnosus TaxID=1234261 RepID=A0A8S2SFQ6_9BILA|nr:unnamed protein product [Didymodactylos carnosus]CAF4227364.1 unnamed protein product [Didymodactylos carnosus]
MWHFGRSLSRTPCYPDSATQDGKGGHIQMNGSPAALTGAGTCNNPGEWKGSRTRGNPFPTYYTVKYCPGDNSWRITYSLYFKHDATHMSDWEWVSVVWWQDSGTDNWYRGYLLQSYHKGQKAERWGDIQNTFAGRNNLDDNNKNEDHPKVFVGAFKHAMFTTKKTSVNVLGAPADEFRSDDWRLFPWDDVMQDGLDIPGKYLDKHIRSHLDTVTLIFIAAHWNWGVAWSSPANIYGDICHRWN